MSAYSFKHDSFTIDIYAVTFTKFDSAKPKFLTNLMNYINIIDQLNINAIAIGGFRRPGFNIFSEGVKMDNVAVLIKNNREW